MARTLVWMTHSFREHSRLTNLLGGECAFVYYSPWHFAGERERNILSHCTQANLDNFYFSINLFNDFLQKKGAELHVYRVKDVVEHINLLVRLHNFDRVVIDQPLFAMWHSVNIQKIAVPVQQIDSDLIDTNCAKMTAKARWTSHIKALPSFIMHHWEGKIEPIKLPGYSGKMYPQVDTPELLDRKKIYDRIQEKIFTYGENRNHHDGQTRVSVALQNGILDPANLFYGTAFRFHNQGIDPRDEEGPAKAILRQMAFREISIIQARRKHLTLEDSPQQWAKLLMHPDAYKNLITATPKPGSKLTWDTVFGLEDTGDGDLNFLIRKLVEDGIMPNRARMYYASRVFYESPTGLDALNTLINTFDIIGFDGQSPNNYTQCIGALGLTYGKVLKMNRDRAWELLGY